MTLEQQIQDLVGKAVREALAHELPLHLGRLVSVPDPDRTYSYAEAAEYLGVTESCVRERVRAGELQVVQLGKYMKIPHASIHELVSRQLDRARFERDQKASILPADIPDDIAELLNPAQPRKKRVSNTKKAQRTKR